MWFFAALMLAVSPLISFDSATALLMLCWVMGSSVKDDGTAWEWGGKLGVTSKRMLGAATWCLMTVYYGSAMYELSLIHI